VRVALTCDLTSLSNAEVELSVRKLNDRVRLIRAEQDYQRVRERAFRDTSETTNSRVLWWSVVQVSGVQVRVALHSFTALTLTADLNSHRDSAVADAVPARILHVKKACLISVLK
jgi:hypothetical protein